MALALAVLVAGFLGWDLAQPADRQLTAGALLGGVRAYRAVLSPVLTLAGVHCRFEPTCSRYAEAVIAEHGAVGGTARAAWRLLRCGPWTPRGTVDPP